MRVTKDTPPPFPTDSTYTRKTPDFLLRLDSGEWNRHPTSHLHQKKKQNKKQQQQQQQQQQKKNSCWCTTDHFTDFVWLVF